MSSLAVAFYQHDDEEIAEASIVVFGGERDVTVSTVSHDPRVAGIAIDQTSGPEVTLTNFGFNSCATFAVMGRVPCQVKGPISKGDCVVTSNIMGVGQKLEDAKYKHGCILGKAMAAIADSSIQIIEVAVGIK
jgi:hypothetical protein